MNHYTLVAFFLPMLFTTVHATGDGANKNTGFLDSVITTGLDRELDDERDGADELNDEDYSEGLCVPMDRLEDLEFFPNFGDELISLGQLLPEADELHLTGGILKDHEHSESGGGTLKDHDEISRESMSDIEFSQDELKKGLRPHENLKDQDEISQESLSVIEFSQDDLENGLRRREILYEQKDPKLGLGRDTKLFPNNSLEKESSFSDEGDVSFSDLLEQSWCMGIKKARNQERDSKIEDDEDTDIGDGEISSIFRKPRSKNVKGKNVNRKFHTFLNPNGKSVKMKKSTKKANTSSNPRNMKRRCSHCQAEKTPQWRMGPNGPHTLCNACGVRYATGWLLPEYRPAASPSFDSNKHSNFHKRIIQKNRNSCRDKCKMPNELFSFNR